MSNSKTNQSVPFDYDILSPSTNIDANYGPWVSTAEYESWLGSGITPLPGTVIAIKDSSTNAITLKTYRAATSTKAAAWVDVNNVNYIDGDNTGEYVPDYYTKAEVDSIISDIQGGTSPDSSGYYTITQADARFVPLQGNATITGTKTFANISIQNAFNMPNLSNGALVVNNGIVGSKSIISEVTQGSQALVTSEGIYDAISDAVSGITPSTPTGDYVTQDEFDSLESTVLNLNNSISSINTSLANTVSTLGFSGGVDEPVTSGSIDVVTGLTKDGNTLTYETTTITIPSSSSSSTPSSDSSSWNANNHPTTLYGYGITDARIEGSKIILGTNNITPITNTDDCLKTGGGIITGNLAINKDSNNANGNLTVQGAVNLGTDGSSTTVGGNESIAGSLVVSQNLQVNGEVIKLNGLANSSGVLRVDSRNVFADNDTYMTFGGSVATYSDLPGSGISVGDTRYIRDTGTSVIATSVTTDTKLYFGLTTPNVSIEIDTTNANTPILEEADFYTGMNATENTFSNYPTLSYIYFPYEQLNTGNYDLHLVPIRSADYGIILALVSPRAGQKKAFALTTLLSYGEMNSWYAKALTNSGELKDITSSIPPSSYNTHIKEFAVFGGGVQWSIIGETKDEAAVLYNTTQSLTDDQKLNACNNISAQSMKLVDDTWSYDDIVDALASGYTLYRLDISGTTETYYHFGQKTADKCAFVSLGYDSGFQILVKSIGSGADDTWTSNQFSLT